MKYLFIILCILLSVQVYAQNTSVKIALLKYSGGGDWYANPTSLTNLIRFANTNLSTNIHPEYATVEAGSSDIFNYPYVFMTGHGNLFFSAKDVENLRNYMTGGGFLHIDDNYGLNKFIRREMKKVFPETDFVELPFSHPIFSQKFDFSTGLPKVHEHDNKPPQAFGIFYQDRLVCLFTYECDLGDGWEDQEVHNDSEDIRTKALKMGCNILSYIFAN
jgi:hypothetical protein